MIYPNPVKNGRLNISLAGTSEYTEAVLLAVTGQAIMKFNLIAGNNSVDVSGIAGGEYILKLNFKNGTNKMMKVFINK